MREATIDGCELLHAAFRLKVRSYQRDLRHADGYLLGSLMQKGRCEKHVFFEEIEEDAGSRGVEEKGKGLVSASGARLACH